LDIARDVHNQAVQGGILFGDVRGVEGRGFARAGVEDEGSGSGGHLRLSPLSTFGFFSYANEVQSAHGLGGVFVRIKVV